MLHRKLYKVSRPCHACNGTGQGACLATCHVCEGAGTRAFKLYANDLEGATLVCYVAPPIDATDPSIRVAPKAIESERRIFMTASEAHEAGLTMMANGEIVRYNVMGWDDFAQLSDAEACEAWEELAIIDQANADARKASEDSRWEDPEQIAKDLSRLGLIQEDHEAPMGWSLTPKGLKHVRESMAREQQVTTAWAKQMARVASRDQYLADKAAQ